MEINEWADFWRYDIGVNVIPADSIKKKTFIKWKDDPRGNWQIEPIPETIHEEWKKTNAFDKGMAVICGKVWHNKDKKHLYLCAIDADNKKGIDELAKDIKEISKKTLVEQHANPNKAHFYFYTTHPMPKKSSDAVNFEIMQKMKDNIIPAIEMKGDGTHGIMYCTPSPHEDGSIYEILGTKEPKILDEVGKIVNKICDEFSLGKGNDNLVPMHVLMSDDTRIIEGSNRHEAIMRYAESILRRYPSIEHLIFRDMVSAKNTRMCVPPLSKEELNKQIQCAIGFINDQIAEEKKLYNERKFVFGTDEFWDFATKYRREHNPSRKYIYCLSCKKEVDDNPLDQEHRGHNVKLK